MRKVSERLGELFGVKPRFAGTEAEPRFSATPRPGSPRSAHCAMSSDQLIEHVADWLKHGGRYWIRPTHFEAKRREVLTMRDVNLIRLDRVGVLALRTHGTADHVIRSQEPGSQEEVRDEVRRIPPQRRRPPTPTHREPQKDHGSEMRPPDIRRRHSNRGAAFQLSQTS